MAVLVDRGPNKRRVKPVNLDLIEYQLLGEGAEDTARALQAVASADSDRAAVALLGGDVSVAAAAEDSDYVEPEPPATRSPTGSPKKSRGLRRRSPRKQTPPKAAGVADAPRDAAAADAPKEDAAADASTVLVTAIPPAGTAAPPPAAEATPTPAAPIRTQTRANRRAKAEAPVLEPPSLDRDVEDGMVIEAAREPLSLQMTHLARWPSEVDAGAAGSGQMTATTAYHDQLVAWVRQERGHPLGAPLPWNLTLM